MIKHHPYSCYCQNETAFDKPTNCPNETNKDVKMQSPGVALKRSSDKYHTMHKKPPVVKSRLNEAVGQQPATLLKMRFRNKWFPVNFAKINRTFFL